MEQEVERYAPSTRWFHWIHAAVFLVLLLTGLFLFLPWVSPAAYGGITRLLHRIFAVIFVLAPLIFVMLNSRRSFAFVKEAFSWGRDDIKWFKAAPKYYFGIEPSGMPPQGHINTGQKLYWMTVLLGGVVFLITGFFMWFLKGIVAPGVFQWMVLFHDVAFIAVGSFFMVHFTLSVLHPRMVESMRSMWGGRVSAHYAKTHHAKWYEQEADK